MGKVPYDNDSEIHLRKCDFLIAPSLAFMHSLIILCFMLRSIIFSYNPLYKILNS